MKKLIVGLAVALGATFAQASYLYWQVSDASATSGSFNGHAVTGYRVVAENTSSGARTVLKSTYLNDSDVWTDESTDPMSSAVAQAGAYANLEAYTAGYSYYVEIMGYDANAYPSDSHIGAIGVSEVMSYAQATSHMTATLESISSVPTAWTGGTYAAPEPTSGLLLLVGASLLALKRRKV